MNVDGSAGVSADFNAGARVGILLPISIGLVLGCLVLGVLAVILLVLAIRQPRATVAVLIIIGGCVGAGRDHGGDHPPDQGPDTRA
jgi:hypothetical protein